MHWLSRSIIKGFRDKSREVYNENIEETDFGTSTYCVWIIDMAKLSGGITTRLCCTHNSKTNTTPFLILDL